jgi:hypothetical protein
LIDDGPAEWAFAVYNEGNVVATGRQKLEGGAGPWIAALSAKLLPGHYQLRAAVRDRSGRAGVVERALDVGLRRRREGAIQRLARWLLRCDTVACSRHRAFPKARPISAILEVIYADWPTLEADPDRD